MDGRRNASLAEEHIARVRALAVRTDDAFLEAAALYASATVDWRRDRLADAEMEAIAADVLGKAGARAFPAEVIMARIKFAQGDWAGAFEMGRSSHEARRRAGAFLPTPLVQITCRSGLSMPTKPGKLKQAPRSSTTPTPRVGSSPRSPIATTADRADPSHGILMRMMTRLGSSTSRQAEALSRLTVLAARQA